jgi:hypothetical protein
LHWYGEGVRFNPSSFQRSGILFNGQGATMKFVGKAYSINPDTIESEIRANVIEELKAMRLPINPLIYNQAIGAAIRVIEKGIK